MRCTLSFKNYLEGLLCLCHNVNKKKEWQIRPSHKHTKHSFGVNVLHYSSKCQWTEMRAVCVMLEENLVMFSVEISGERYNQRTVTGQKQLDSWLSLRPSLSLNLDGRLLTRQQSPYWKCASRTTVFTVIPLAEELRGRESWERTHPRGQRDG